MSSPPRRIAVAIGRPLPIPMADPLSGLPLAPAEPKGPRAPAPQTPLIDIHEGPDGLVLEADLPGATEQAVQILMEDNVLNLQVEIPAPAGPQNRLLHQEYPVPGVFQRSFILSDEVDRARISAELRNGVLRLHLPKAERARSRRIEVRNQPEPDR